MNELKEGPDFQNGEGDNNNSPQSKKAKTLIEILRGLGISAAAYIIIWLALFVRIPALAMGIAILELAVLGFITVKFYRLKRMVVATTILVLITPLLLAMLLLGACGLIRPMF